jgi:hypothetical protein
MCPACIGNAALIVGGALSAGGAGGWTAFVLRRPRGRAIPGQESGSPSRVRPHDNQEPATIKESPS